MKKYSLLIAAAVFLTALPVFAATFKTGQVVVQKEAALADNLYVFGGSVDVSGTVEGDVITAGGNVSVDGTVSQDVAALGGTVTILGSIGGDVRTAGGNVSVSGSVGGDLLAAGGFVKVLSGSTISKDLVAAGGTVVMDGAVTGNMTVYGKDVAIDGPINGNVTLKDTRTVTLGPNAHITGNLTYSADQALTIAPGVVGGEVTRVPLPVNTPTEHLGAILGFLALIKFITLLITSVLAVLIFKKLSTRVGSVAQENFWKQALVGFVVLVVTPVAVFLLLASVVGIMIGFLLLIGYILMLMAACIYSTVVAGALLSKWIQKRLIVDWKWTIAGLVALTVIAFIPFVGPLIVFIIAMASLGGLSTHAYAELKRAR